MLYRIATFMMTLSDLQPPKTTTISTFYVAFHIFVAGKRIQTSNLVCGLNIASPSLQMTTVPEMGVVTSRDAV